MIADVLTIAPGKVVTASGSSNDLPGYSPQNDPYGGGLPVGGFDDLSVDVSVTALTGGGASVQFWIDRLGTDGVWYPIANSAVLTAPGVFSTTLAAQNSQSQSFGKICRLRWVVAGTTPSITLSASIIGKG